MASSMDGMFFARHLISQRSAWPVAVVSLVLLAGGASPALGQAPAADSAEQGSIPMQKLDLAAPLDGQKQVSPAGAPVAKPPAEQSPFMRDSRFGGVVRTYYFNRDKFDSSRSVAWALGGWLNYRSGYLADLLRLGATVYTSQPLYAPDDRDGTSLLKPGQDGFTVLGQIYGEVKFAERIFGAIGRKEYETPYVNKNDNRMTPQTFEGATVYGRAGGKDGRPEWRFGGGYLSKIKTRNSDEFVWMSRAVGASVDRGTYLAGVNFESRDFSLGAINYYSDDIINIFYAEGAYGLKLDGGNKLKLGAQFSNQDSTGDNLLRGSAFSNHQWGFKADLSAGSALLTAAYTDTGNGPDLRSPWGAYPGYTFVQVQEFNRSNESALMFKGWYDFSRRGAQGLSAYALYVHGAGRESPFHNEDEYDLNLQWTPKAGMLKGTSFRLRYARVAQRGGGDPAINDFRIIVNYDF
ncbi:MAG: outer membrane porin, OprD family [Burkholderiales bacterium]|nr:outer membrane porin, OprD family [Burkholderiales bacterium]